MGPLTLRSINAVEVQGIVIHRSTYFGLTDAHDVYPQMSNAEHRALVEWERRRADMIADLPDSVDE